jgi:hypothetical protein
MLKKLAKLKYLPNNFEVVEQGDYVLCAISGKKISIENLNYWNVDLQEAYYSYVEAHKKKRLKIVNLLPSIVCPNPLIWVFEYHAL